jgi:hypothetical protein
MKLKFQFNLHRVVFQNNCLVSNAATLYTHAFCYISKTLQALNGVRADKKDALLNQKAYIWRFFAQESIY